MAGRDTLKAPAMAPALRGASRSMRRIARLVGSDRALAASFTRFHVTDSLHVVKAWFVPGAFLGRSRETRRRLGVYRT